MSKTTSLKVFHVGSFSLVSNRIAIALDGVKVLFFLENKKRISQNFNLECSKLHFCRILQTANCIF